MVFKTVLIVDYDNETRASLRKIFEDAGHFVISVTTGAEAFLILEKLSPPSIALVATNSLMMSGENFLARFLSYERYSKILAVQIKHSATEPDLPKVCGALVLPITPKAALEILKHCE